MINRVLSEAPYSNFSQLLKTKYVLLIAIAEEKDGVQRALKPVHIRYAQYINRQHKWSGHLWQVIVKQICIILTLGLKQFIISISIIRLA